MSVCLKTLSPGATKMSYQKDGQATDDIIMKRMKEKLGNNSYLHSKRDARNSVSPRTPKQVENSN